MLIGIDLGGSKIEGIVIDRSGQIVQTRRMRTPVDDGYEAILTTIAKLIDFLESSVGKRCSVGIGTPGAISTATNTLKNSNTVCMNGRPVKQDLEMLLQREIRIENDANCFTLSEASDGAAQGRGIVFGVILGTGVGGGLVINGALHSGPQHIAGEWGHNILVANGRPCYCGRKGCVETYLSGPGLSRQWEEEAGEPGGLTAEEIVQRASHGDPRASSVMAHYFQYFGQAIATVINILDPDAIVLGGGMSNIKGLYTEGVSYTDRYVFNDEMNTPILQNRHGDSSGVRGAAWLWKP